MAVEGIAGLTSKERTAVVYAQFMSNAVAGLSANAKYGDIVKKDKVRKEIVETARKIALLCMDDEVLVQGNIDITLQGV